MGDNHRSWIDDSHDSDVCQRCRNDNCMDVDRISYQGSDSSSICWRSDHCGCALFDLFIRRSVVYVVGSRLCSCIYPVFVPRLAWLQWRFDIGHLPHVDASKDYTCCLGTSPSTDIWQCALGQLCIGCHLGRDSCIRICTVWPFGTRTDRLSSGIFDGMYRFGILGCQSSISSRPSENVREE